MKISVSGRVRHFLQLFMLENRGGGEENISNFLCFLWTYLFVMSPVRIVPRGLALTHF